MPSITLVGREPNEAVPALAVYATDAELRPIASDRVDERGAYMLPEDAVEKAAYIVVAPFQEKPDKLDRAAAVLYRPDQYREVLKTSNETIELARPRWLTLFPLFPRCVIGRVRRCPWHPWWDYSIRLAQSVKLAPAPERAIDLGFKAALQLSPTPVRPPEASVEGARQNVIAFHPSYVIPDARTLVPFRCASVCSGSVEVYQRVCCRWPIVVFDPRIPEIIRRLEEAAVVIQPIPRIRVNPNPPDPPPFETLHLFKGGALDEAALNAPQDLLALRSLPATEQAAYIEARPYLRHLTFCGTAARVGQGVIGPDGAFQVCWPQYPTLLLPNCHFELAYVVKQVINGVTVTIYDGLAANQWYGLGETPTLTSYHPEAVACGGRGVTPGGAAIFLEDIGDAHAYRLKTPAARGWDRVAPSTEPTAFNDGLADPESDAEAARGRLRNRNWGGTLKLRWWFTEPCLAAGVRYYRASVVRADASGAPVAGEPRIFLSPRDGRWKRLRDAGTRTEDVPLGVPPRGVEANLFVIPYDVASLPGETFAPGEAPEWASDQYHAELDTTDKREGRWLLTLEVFDESGNKLTPQGTAADQGLPASAERPFLYKRWNKPPPALDEFVDVPFAGLTHLLWWDNRPGTAEILGLERNGDPTVGECQFLTGPASTRLGVRFIAHHPVEMFQLRHGLQAFRGISGTPIDVGVNAENRNEGAPPSTAATSLAVPFSTLLGTHEACSFALHLNMSLKTFNGSSDVGPNGLRDVAAFALRIGPEPVSGGS
jgi:hypothetical protein